MVRIQELIRPLSPDIVSTLHEARIIIGKMLMLTKEKHLREKYKRRALQGNVVYEPIGTCSFTFTTKFAKDIICSGNTYSLFTTDHTFQTLVSNTVYTYAAIQ
jgi:hypothetical protein